MHTFDGYIQKKSSCNYHWLESQTIRSHHFDGKANCDVLEIALLIFSDLILDELYIIYDLSTNNINFLLAQMRFFSFVSDEFIKVHTCTMYIED